MRAVSEVADERLWQWLRAWYLSKSMEGYVFTAQEQALQKRFFWATIEKENVGPMKSVWQGGGIGRACGQWLYWFDKEGI